MDSPKHLIHGHHAAFLMLVDMAVEHPSAALVRLPIARAYAMSAQVAKARAQYQDFLTSWKEADTEIPILRQAKRVYAKLPMVPASSGWPSGPWNAPTWRGKTFHGWSGKTLHCRFLTRACPALSLYGR